MTMIQFGNPQEGTTYRERQAAFGVVERGGRIAVVAITVKPGESPVYDLPGGGVDPGETEQDALVREFGEETGLRVMPGDLLVRAAQFHVKPEGEAVNNRGAFYAASLRSQSPDLKVEDDHELVWLAPEQFIRVARHDAQAWAVCVWMRRRD